MSVPASSRLEPHALPSHPTGGSIKWWVCGLLFLALMLNYMDRQTLSLTITPISNELGLSKTQYGQLEKGFSYAFAVGGIFIGALADRWGARWLFPLVLLGWSAAGVATGYGDRIGLALAPSVASLLPNAIDPSSEADRAFLGFLACRTVLGFFEAGVWPCALITTQRLLEPRDRPLGNSMLQSGASIGAILTPLAVHWLVANEPGAWRGPFVVLGALGVLWILPWGWLVSRVRLEGSAPADPAPKFEASSIPAVESPNDSNRTEDSNPYTAPPDFAPVKQSPKAWPAGRGVLLRRYAALVIVVICINLTWQFFRAWLPRMLEEYHHYPVSTVRYFTAAFYLTTDVGCIAAGFLVRHLAARGITVKTARVITFLACALLTSSTMVAANLERGPLLLVTLLVFAFGALGLFPIYYSLTQDLSTRHQGKVTGSLGCLAWIATAEMQAQVGRHVDATQSYTAAIFWVGLLPLIGLVALLVLWGKSPHDSKAVAA